MSENNVHAGNQDGCHQVGAESHSFGNGTRDDGDCRATKDQLKDEEGQTPRRLVSQPEALWGANDAGLRCSEHQGETKEGKEKAREPKVGDIF
jgi:hypothetical protein